MLPLCDQSCYHTIHPRYIALVEAPSEHLLALYMVYTLLNGLTQSDHLIPSGVPFAYNLPCIAAFLLSAPDVVFAVFVQVCHLARFAQDLFKSTSAMHPMWLTEATAYYEIGLRVTMNDDARVIGY